MLMHDEPGEDPYSVGTSHIDATQEGLQGRGRQRSHLTGTLEGTTGVAVDVCEVHSANVHAALEGVLDLARVRGEVAVAKAVVNDAVTRDNVRTLLTWR